jgi:hypothetical protein
METLIESLGIEHTSQSTFLTPYHSGHSIDAIPHETVSTEARNDLRLKYQSLVGSLNLLAHMTGPDISTAVSLLVHHQSDPSNYVARYLANTKTLGIYFTSCRHATLESFLHFPVPPHILAMADANWGPQDASLSESYCG